MKRKIAIDISPVLYQTGVSFYTEELVKRLVLSPDFDFLLYGGSLRRANELKNFTNKLKGKFEQKIVYIPPLLADILWNRLHVFKIERIIGGCDIFHSSDWAQPPSDSFKVTTVHDLSPILFPSQTHPKIVKTHKRRLMLVKKEVDQIIVPTKSTKNDLLNLGFDEKKIVVIHEALHKREINNKEAVLEKFGIKGNFALTVGTAPRKNIKRTISAFHLAQKRVDIETLVVVGAKPVDIEQSENVIFTGHVEEGDLGALFACAHVFLYASLYEGFGLPILEAFEAKIPVVTSNISSMPEVAGDAAVLVDPKNTDDIAKGIEKALKNRKNLVRRGSLRLKGFSWNKAAEDTLAVYKKLLN